MNLEHRKETSNLLRKPCENYNTKVHTVEMTPMLREITKPSAFELEARPRKGVL